MRKNFLFLVALTGERNVAGYSPKGITFVLTYFRQLTTIVESNLKRYVKL